MFQTTNQAHFMEMSDFMDISLGFMDMLQDLMECFMELKGYFMVGNGYVKAFNGQFIRFKRISQDLREYFWGFDGIEFIFHGMKGDI